MKKLSLTPLLIIVWILTACSAGNTTAMANNNTSGVAGTPQPFDPTSLPLESKLAMGTLKLEGTDLAVTREQATNLLPLWKAVKSLATSDTTTQDEINALYQQIEETLTPEQINAIKVMTWTSQEIQSLMQNFGIDTSNFAGTQGANGLTQEQRATRIAQFQSQGGGNFRGGEPGFQPPAGGGEAGFAPPPESSAQQTPDPTRMASRRRTSMNQLFIDPLIKLLEQKISG